MKLMHKVMCLATLAVCGAVQAQQSAPVSAARQDLAKQLIDLTMTRDYSPKMLESMEKNTEQQIYDNTPRIIDSNIENYAKQRNLTPAEKQQMVAERVALVEAYRAKAIPEYRKEFNNSFTQFDPNKEMANAMQSWYEQNFSEDELKQILAYQKTPVAAKLRENMPKFMAVKVPEINRKIMEQSRSIAEKTVQAASFPDLVAAKLCSPKSPKFCNDSKAVKPAVTDSKTAPKK